MTDIICTIEGRVGLITLNRPKALNALSLGMVRTLTQVLLEWRDDPQVLAVAVRGSNKDGVFGAFCAGGDIRFFHQAALAGNPELEDFFTEEYELNHLIQTYSKPYIAFMDGIVMGGGMGISQGASLRIVTERTKMAMPETGIGLFPDVGGGYFLSRCPGRVGEYLALTGDIIGGRQAVRWGLADGYVESTQLANLWNKLIGTPFESGAAVEHWLATQFLADHSHPQRTQAELERAFAKDSVMAIVSDLEATDSDWARQAAATLRKRSPLMLHVVLEQIRRGRQMGLANNLRQERNLVRQCFQWRPGVASETVEGIRALAVDKDHTPRWNPARIEDVAPADVEAFFKAPWPDHAHPLRHLA